MPAQRHTISFVEEIGRRWPSTDLPALAHQIADVERWAHDRARDSLLDLNADEIEQYLDTLSRGRRLAVEVSLRRLFGLARDAGVIEALPFRSEGSAAQVELIGRFPEMDAVLAAACAGLTASGRRSMLRSMSSFAAWCAGRHVDPMRITAPMAEQYLATEAPDPADVIHWRSLYDLRRFFDAAITLGLREVHPFPRRVRIGVSRRDDQLALFVKRVVRTYGKGTRATVSSRLTSFIDAARDGGYDPLNMSRANTERLFRNNQADLARLWRPLGLLYGEAAKKDLLGLAGRKLHDEIVRGAMSGRRRLKPTWAAWTRQQGYSHPGIVPSIVREKYLSAMRAGGAEREAVESMREVIREYELEAERGGLREPMPSHRLNRFSTRLVLVGVAAHDVDRFIDALHAGYSINSHRWRDAELARYFDWCAAHGIAPAKASAAELAAYLDDIVPVARKVKAQPEQKKKRLGLGTAPAKRFIATFVAYQAHTGPFAPGADLAGEPGPIDISAAQPVAVGV